MRKASEHTSIRFTPEARRLLEALSQRLGVSKTAVLEMAVRKFAEREGVSGNEPPKDKP